MEFIRCIVKLTICIECSYERDIGMLVLLIDTINSLPHLYLSERDSTIFQRLWENQRLGIVMNSA